MGWESDIAVRQAHILIAQGIEEDRKLARVAMPTIPEPMAEPDDHPYESVPFSSLVEGEAYIFAARSLGTPGEKAATWQSYLKSRLKVAPAVLNNVDALMIATVEERDAHFASARVSGGVWLYGEDGWRVFRRI